ncbi:MAG: hypothetical protein FGM58_10775 [Acidimicrobiia bacterium]|nr:hypothetical protein [Acidimicrobiia bacterium]
MSEPALHDDTPTDTTADVTTDASTDASASPVLRVTDEALDRIIEIRDGEPEPQSMCLRVAIVGANGADFAYDLGWADIGELDVDDDVSVQAGLSVVVTADSIDRMRGSVLDLPTDPAGSGFVIRNPNRPERPNPMEGRNLTLTGELADAVQELLLERINPQLADHGGYAALVGVEGSTVFVSMGGGCQGCAMSAMTLREGITAQILESVPGVDEVIDVTDHDAGAMPYYT